MSNTPNDPTPPIQPPPAPQTPYHTSGGMPPSYAEPGRAPSRLIFSERTDQAIGFLAKVTAVYLIIGLALLVLMLILMVALGGFGMWGMRGY